ncbi:MAG: hypothetical protein SVV03_04825 [Candidatus Nanohaloarchaea archaeon]|nr:hypothetical protein [Candidatus Nanohaloarchaea archaeon]
MSTNAQKYFKASPGGADLKGEVRPVFNADEVMVARDGRNEVLVAADYDSDQAVLVENGEAYPVADLDTVVNLVSERYGEGDVSGASTSMEGVASSLEPVAERASKNFEEEWL